MSRIVFFYLFRQHLGLALLVLGCIFLIVLLGQFTEMARFQAERDDWTLWTSIQLTFLRAPSLMQAVLPHIILISSALMVARSGQRLEVAVLMQNGVSPAMLLFPVALAAVLIGLTFTLLVHPLASQSFNASELVIRQNVNVANDPNRRDPREIVLQQDEGAIYVVIDHVDHNANRLHGVTAIFVDTKHQQIRGIEAAGAAETGEGWRLEQPVEVFAAEEMTFPPAEELRLSFAAEALAERFDSQATVPFFDLPSRIRLGKLVGAPTARIEVQYLWLLALPGLLGAVSLLAGAIVLRPLQRGGWKADAVLILAAAFLIYTISTVFDALGIKGVVRPQIATLVLPSLCFAAAVGLLWARRGGNRIFRRRSHGAAPVAGAAA